MHSQPPSCRLCLTQPHLEAKRIVSSERPRHCGHFAPATGWSCQTLLFPRCLSGSALLSPFLHVKNESSGLSNFPKEYEVGLKIRRHRLCLVYQGCLYILTVRGRRVLEGQQGIESGKLSSSLIAVPIILNSMKFIYLRWP